MTVQDNVAMVPRLLAWKESDVHARVAELLSIVGLPPAEFATRYPDELSGGQRQRVGVARALAARPHILLLDEPFGALDPITRVLLQRELRTIHRDLGLTTLMVTHDILEALSLADRVAVMYRGELRQLSTPSGADDLAGGRLRGGARLHGPAPERRAAGAHRGGVNELLEGVPPLLASHLELVLVALSLACALGLPLAMLASARPRLALVLVTGAGVVQTGARARAARPDGAHPREDPPASSVRLCSRGDRAHALRALCRCCATR